ncbi:MAG: hypothetical protein E6767_03895 [Dysgonomonas sp.]|nr:hypothetical protein [Dysgonomonas sp.]
MTNKLSPLEELRQERAIVKKECSSSEDRLAIHWLYIKDNAGSIIFSSILSSIAHSLGFGGFKSSSNKSKNDRHESSGFMSNIYGALSPYLPFVWEIAQPLLLRFAVKKIKSIFSGKKKRKYDD